MLTAEVAKRIYASGESSADSKSPGAESPGAEYARTLITQARESFNRCFPMIREELAPEIARRILRGGGYFVNPHDAQQPVS